LLIYAVGPKYHCPAEHCVFSQLKVVHVNQCFDEAHLHSQFVVVYLFFGQVLDQFREDGASRIHPSLFHPVERRNEFNPALFQSKSFLLRSCAIVLIINELDRFPEILPGQWCVHYSVESIFLLPSQSSATGFQSAFLTTGFPCQRPSQFKRSKSQDRLNVVAAI